jgi:hypothetical protein
LIIVALVVAWLLVLVPIAARRRQEVAKTADSTLAARVVRSGGVSAKVEEAFTVSDSPDHETDKAKLQVDTAELDEDDLDDLDEDDLDQDDFDDEDLEPDELDVAEADELAAEDYDDEYADENEVVDEYYEDEDYDDQRRVHRPYRPGRGGFDPAAAAASARAKYTIRQRIVLVVMVLAIATAILAVLTKPIIWWAHGLLDIGLISYLSYLRRQVRIEDDIRQRRTARLGAEAEDEAYRQDYTDYDAERDYREADRYDAPPAPRATLARPVARPRPRPGTVVVETDDDDPIFDDLDQPGVLPYRRAVGE